MHSSSCTRGDCTRAEGLSSAGLPTEGLRPKATRLLSEFLRITGASTPGGTPRCTGGSRRSRTTSSTQLLAGALPSYVSQHGPACCAHSPDSSIAARWVWFSSLRGCPRLLSRFASMSSPFAKAIAAARVGGSLAGGGVDSGARSRCLGTSPGLKDAPPHAPGMTGRFSRQSHHLSTLLSPWGQYFQNVAPLKGALEAEQGYKHVIRGALHSHHYGNTKYKLVLTET